ncbi:MAG: thymidine phosphorylase [Pseudomonadales bacterium RIFCSPHIGHO2_02_FULL_60_43]|nr:MAG: thymidine phosphorylase [Pseudomonadales bacterium RIFCSPHIGHO2_02_FULL_60_43]
MKTDANVVHLSKVSPEQPPTSPVGRLPVALTNVRDKAAQQLKTALQALFDNADDTLFEMADRATSNAEQNAFFEAMRDLRLKRKSIERGFLQKVFEAFATLNQYEIGKPAPLDAVSFDTLSLVQNDALEESVALDSMVAKVVSRDGAALSHLTTRFNAMVSKKLDDKSNPIGPASLCEFFLDACSSLGVEIRVKLIILKLFEKYVLSDLDQLYAEANQALIAAGVLPELKSAPARRNPSRASAPAGAVRQDASSELSAEFADEGVQEVFGALQELLSQARGSAIPRSNRPADAMPISSNDLMRLLSHMQQRAPAQVSDDFDLREQLEGLLTRASAKAGKARVVGEVDEDVINLVSMLFEFILDDRTLPDSLKALIGRLQIPMLKVAVIDKTFFSRGSHPARRLLNEIASAALGWGEQDDAQRDSLYQKIEQVVQRLLNDFVDDPVIFSELLAEFLAFTGDERRRSELLEQRTRDAEEGSAKAAMARREVEQALNERLLGKTLPEVVVRLLQEAWSKVLMLTCLKHGVESAEWQAALATMDDLVWSVELHEEPEARMRLLEMVPGLLKALREGMASAAFDPFSTGEFFSQLEALHVQAFQRFKRSLPEEHPQGDAPALAEIDEEQRAALAAAGIELPLLELPAAEVVEEPAMVEVVEEIILLAPGELRAAEPEASLPDDDESLLQVDNLRVGSWVEFQEDEEHKLRCKLAAVIKPTGKYIFVNRTGMKVLEKTRMGLAVEFRRNAIRLLDDALLFDRALESVIGNLRKLKGA